MRFLPGHYFYILLLGLLNVKISGKSIGVAHSTELRMDLQDFMLKIGWLRLQGREQATADELTESVKGYQRFNHLPETGQLDSETVQIMNSRFCGVADVRPDESTNESTNDTVRQGRYVFSNRKWLASTLRWKLVESSGPFNHDDLRTLMTRAVFEWANPTNINIEETSGSAEIDVRFVIPNTAGYHNGGDNTPFDSMDLGHAFYPGNLPLDGDMHINMNQAYYISTMGQYNAFASDLMFVVVHEIGHSLGLDHSGQPSAVMYPSLSRGRNYAGLTSDDVNGIQFPYGANPFYSSGSHHEVSILCLALTSLITGLLLSRVHVGLIRLR